MIQGINHITLAVREIERSFRFYLEVLGLRPLVKWNSGAYFLAGDFWFCISLDKHTRSGPLVEYTHLAFSVSQNEFDSMSAKIREAGTVIWKENRSEGDSLYFLDPDGHKLELHVGDWRSRIEDAKRESWSDDMKFFV